MTVGELLTIVLSRLPGPATCSIFEAVREIQGIVFNRLMMRQSLIAHTRTVLTYRVGLPPVVTVPSDFLGLVDLPYVEKGRSLMPAPAAGGGSPAVTLSTPQHFSLVGRELWISPPPAEEVQLWITYYAKPATPTAVTDTLPWSGVFDSVLIDGSVKILGAGLPVVADRSFAAMIQSQVDAVLEAQDAINEQMVADAINAGTLY